MKNNELDNEFMGSENDFPFEEKEEIKESKYTRSELEKLSNKDLAKIAEPLQNRYSFSSLKGRSKAYLIDIILGIKDEEEISINPSTAKAPHTTNESAELISFGLNVLNSFKQQRDGQNAELNPIAKELFKNSAVNSVDKARADGIIKTDKFNTLIMGLSGTALIIDGVIGFNNIPTLFQKLKNRINSKSKK